MKLGIFSGMHWSAFAKALFWEQMCWPTSWRGQVPEGGMGKPKALSLWRGGVFWPCTLFFDAWKIHHCACSSFRVTAEAGLWTFVRKRGLKLCQPSLHTFLSFGLIAVHQPCPLPLWRQLSVATHKLPLWPPAPCANVNMETGDWMLKPSFQVWMEGEFLVISGLGCEV